MPNGQTTQRAVILAAGLGSRLHPLTEKRPKPLVPIHGVPILHNALHNLADIGVTEVTIVVGYCKEAIQRSCGTSFAGVKITYCESNVFERTGSAYSLWLARYALLSGSSFILEGDVFFEPDVLKELASHSAANVAAVAPFDHGMSGSAVTLSPNDSITEVRMDQSAPASSGVCLFKTMNLMRLSAETLRHALVPALDQLVADGATRSYVEQVLRQLIDEERLELNASHCGHFKWFEIDSEQDLRIAEAIFEPTRHPARQLATGLGR